MIEIIKEFVPKVNILSPENLFLIFLGLIWIIVAVIQDFRKREVANWWNFSLIIIALVYRSFLSLELENAVYITIGFIGLSIGFLFAELFYYTRIFAGGDAKLLMALGTILPLSLSFSENFILFLLFVMAFLFSGAIYGMVYSIFLVFINFNEFKKGFLRRVYRYKFAFLLIFIFCLILTLIAFYSSIDFLFYISVLIFLSPLLIIYAKVIEEICLNKYIDVRDLSVGDWTIKNIKVKNKIIKPNWEGLSEEQVKILKKNYKGKVLVREGIPFTPAFLFGFLIIIIFLYVL